ncbi:MAG TPA: NAD(+)/NADH kinase, partial [bacterium]|nr:NAD(+)/NADH kinase [bacterium]
KIFINNNLMTELPGDGFIVASATGSTGYSLSAGGPVVAPELDVLVLTPICPHSLFGRSIVVSGGETIRVELPKDRNDLIMTIDGQKEYFPQSGGSVVIRRAPYSVKYVRVTESVFFETVKDKFRLA